MNNKRGNYARALLFMLAGVFLLTQNVSTESTSIVINEIAAYEASGHEWVELYNSTDETIDLTGWKFIENDANHGLHFIQDSDDDASNDWLMVSGSYAIITQNDQYFLADYPTFTGKVLDSSWGTLNEGGEEIGLRDADGEVVELFTYIPARDFSLERIDAGLSEYTEGNWIEHEDGNSVGKPNFSSIEEQAKHALRSLGEGGKEEEVIEDPVVHEPQDEPEAEDNVVEDEEEPEEQDNDSIDNVEPQENEQVEQPNNAAEQEPNNDVEPQHAAAQEQADENNTQIKINEFVSHPNDGEAEWIELFNAGATTAIITNWTVYDGVGEISSVSTTMASSSFFVIELASSKLNNSGDIIILKNNNDEIIDQIAYGNWNDDNNIFAPNQSHSIARNIDGIDTDQITDWSETVSTTKGFANQIILNNVDDNDAAPVEPQHAAAQSAKRSNRGGGGSSSPMYPAYNPGDIIINEFVSDPADGAVEFIELYNPKEQTITISKWWIEEGSEAKTIIDNEQIASKAFFVIEKPKGNLNNSGDTIVLYDSHGTEIDSVSYGNFDDGNIDDNAPSAKDPFSISRKIDGQNSDVDKYDFTITKAITKGEANQILITDNQNPRRDAACCVSNSNNNAACCVAYQGSTALRINEIFPNPEGSDSEDEFIELINVGDEAIDLSGWILGDASKKRFSIKEGILKSGETEAFFRKQTKIALNNGSGDTVKLFLPGTVETQHAASQNPIQHAASLTSIQQTTPIDHITYPSAPENQSFARRDDGDFDWTSAITPNKANEILGQSAAPIISIDAQTDAFVGDELQFDASDSMDPEGEALAFQWDFGDKKNRTSDVINYTFMQAGVHTVQLSVSDTSGNTSTAEIIVTIAAPQLQVSSIETNQDFSRIHVTEFFPNPEGADNTEFIELYNAGDESVDLSGLYIDDEDGGSKPYQLPDETMIEAKSFLLIGRQESKVILNNSSDSVRLLDEDKQVLFERVYDDVIEGASYSWNEEIGFWQWTSDVTPGQANKFVAVEEKKTSKKVSAKTKKKKEKIIIQTTIEEIRDQDIGDPVQVEGVVSVIPGILGSQYMYINSPSSTVLSDEEASQQAQGIQLYMYKKDFPDLLRGDVLEVTGELSQSGGEYRIKIKEKSDIQIISSQDPIEALPTEIVALGDAYEGTLVQVMGEITEKKSSHVYIDDGTEEIKVYIKKGTTINTSDIQLGDIVEINGIVSETKSGYRLLPRDQTDIHIRESVQQEESLQPVVPAAPTDQERALQYLTATAGGITTLLFGFITKAHGAWLVQQAKQLISRRALRKS